MVKWVIFGCFSPSFWTLRTCACAWWWWWRGAAHRLWWAHTCPQRSVRSPCCLCWWAALAWWGQGDKPSGSASFWGRAPSYAFWGSETGALVSCKDPLIFSGCSDGKESAYNTGYLVSIPGLGRSSGAGNGNPLQYSCLENPRNRGTWQATVHRVSESDTTETNTFISFFPQKWL